MKKNLIVYYSHSGNTEKAARLIAEATSGDLCEIVPQTPYPENHDALVAQAKKEIAGGFLPLLKTAAPDLSGYGRIFIGTPNWWSTAAPPVTAFLKKLNLENAEIAVFCTHGGGGLARVESDIKKEAPKAIFSESLAIYGSSADTKTVRSWVEALK